MKILPQINCLLWMLPEKVSEEEWKEWQNVIKEQRLIERDGVSHKK